MRNVLHVGFVKSLSIAQLIVYTIGKDHLNLHSIDSFCSGSSSRNCGDGVCENCSPTQRPVPERDWLTPVRVCKWCDETMNHCKSKA